MVKSKTKKRDFNKTKLKIGKKLSKPDNYTNTEFKSKQLEIRVQKASQNLSAPDKIEILVKQVCRSNGNINVDSINKLEKLCRSEKQFLSNNSHLVRDLLTLWGDIHTPIRKKAVMLFKTLFTLINDKQIEAFFPELRANLNMALNHIDTGIRSDAFKFFDLILKNYPNVARNNFNCFFESLMDVVKHKRNLDNSHKGILERFNKLLDLIKNEKTAHISVWSDAENWKTYISRIMSLFDFINFNTRELYVMVNILVAMLEIVVLFTKQENKTINMNWFLHSFQGKLNKFLNKSFPFDLDVHSRESTLQVSSTSINLKACHACIFLFPNNETLINKVTEYLISHFTQFYHKEELTHLLEIINLTIGSCKPAIFKSLIKKMIECFPSMSEPNHSVLFTYLVKDVIDKHYPLFKDLIEMTQWINNMPMLLLECPKTFIPTYVEMMNCVRARNVPCFYESIQNNLHDLIDFMIYAMEKGTSQDELAYIICDRASLNKEHFRKLVVGSKSLDHSVIRSMIMRLADRVSKYQGRRLNGIYVENEIDDSHFISFVLYFITDLNAERINCLSEVESAIGLSVVALEEIIKDAEKNLNLSRYCIYLLLALPMKPQVKKLVVEHVDTLFQICRPLPINSICAFLHFARFYETMWNNNLIESVVDSLLLIFNEIFNESPLTDCFNAYLEEFYMHILEGKLLPDILGSLIRRADERNFAPNVSSLIIASQEIYKKTRFDTQNKVHYKYLMDSMKEFIPSVHHWILHQFDSY